MYTQADLERLAADALATLGAGPESDTISNALDLVLCARERETGQAIDRASISPDIASAAIGTATAWVLEVEGLHVAPAGKGR